MTGLVEEVRTKVGDGCLDKKCKKDGCRVSLKGAPQPHLIIDLDKLDSHFLDKSQTRCDYLFVADGNRNGGWVVPLELKKGRYDASEVVKQLEAGRKVAEDVVPGKTKVRFRPVLVFGKAPHPVEILELRRSKIRFRGSEKHIESMKCGLGLREKLKEESS